MGKHFSVKTQKKEGQKANVGAPIHGHGCMAPFLQVFMAPGGDGSQQPQIRLLNCCCCCILVRMLLCL